jgi:hypothetical protein
MEQIIGGIIVGFMFALALNSLPSSYHTLARDAVKECEKSLPRDQTCKIIAVPKETQEKK